MFFQFSDQNNVAWVACPIFDRFATYHFVVQIYLRLIVSAMIVPIGKKIYFLTIDLLPF